MLSNTSATYTVTDCRSLVKTLVSGVKTITWGAASCKAPNVGRCHHIVLPPHLRLWILQFLKRVSLPLLPLLTPASASEKILAYISFLSVDAALVQNKQFLPKETLVYVDLVKYALQALDIYTINVSAAGQTSIRPAVVQSVRTKEEKDVLEHFAGVFTMMNPLTFKEIFSTTIEYMVDRIHCNYALQIVANTFLAQRSTSATFATILVEYLLARMWEMGSNPERSNLYLKLFKLVFGSVSLLAAENEQMLKVGNLSEGHVKAVII